MSAKIIFDSLYLYRFFEARARASHVLVKKNIHEQYIILLAAFNLFFLFFRKKWGLISTKLFFHRDKERIRAKIQFVFQKAGTRPGN